MQSQYRQNVCGIRRDPLDSRFECHKVDLIGFAGDSKFFEVLHQRHYGLPIDSVLSIFMLGLHVESKMELATSQPVRQI